MGRINARSKGQRGEHLAIDFMKDWTGMDFRRTPGSGGLRGHVVDYTEGDIVCVKKNYIFPLCLEVKFYEELNFSHLLYDSRVKKAKVKGIKKFWKQTSSSAKRAEKVPILLMRYNGLPKDVFFVMISYRFFRRLGVNFKKQFIVENRVVITTTRELKTLAWGYVDKAAKVFLNI